MGSSGFSSSINIARSVPNDGTTWLVGAGAGSGASWYAGSDSWLWLAGSEKFGAGDATGLAEGIAMGIAMGVAAGTGAIDGAMELDIDGMIILLRLLGSALTGAAVEAVVAIVLGELKVLVVFSGGELNELAA